MRHRLGISHGNALRLLTRARGLRSTPPLRHAVLSAALTIDQADLLIGVFASRRAAFVERDVDMLIEHVNTLSVHHTAIVAKRWADCVDAELVADLVASDPTGGQETSEESPADPTTGAAAAPNDTDTVSTSNGR